MKFMPQVCISKEFILSPSPFFLLTNSTIQWTFLTFLFIFEVGSLICGLATNSSMLIAGRVIAGLGTSGILSGALLIIAECIPMQKRPTMIGIVMGVGQLGLASGPLFGGLLTECASWRWCAFN